MLVGKLLLRGKKYKEAETRLAKVVESMSAGDPAEADGPGVPDREPDRPGQDGRHAEKELDRPDRRHARTRASAASPTRLLGDYHMKKGQSGRGVLELPPRGCPVQRGRRAHARALYQLAKLFDKVKKDPLRGKECLTRLLDKRFEGSPYQKLVPKGDTKE